MKKQRIEDAVKVQLHTFFLAQSKRAQSHYQNSASKKDVSAMFDWTEEFAEQYISSRLARAKDLESPEVEKARKLARTFIGEGNHDFFATCVDGRNMPTVMFSKPPHVGGVLRAPAGAVTGFLEGQKPGTVYIDEDSYVVKQIAKLLEERAGETLYYGLDSHVGCAARGLIHSTEGGKQKDSGLRSDVKSKLMTAKGIVALRKGLISAGKKAAEVVPTFFSYDPHHGTVIAGLEMHVDDAIVSQEGYTDAVLEQLAKEEKIVRVSDFLEDSAILSQLEEAIRPASADFHSRFAESMLTNWRTITQLYDGGTGKIYQKILAALTKAYTVSGWEISDKDVIGSPVISKKTVKQKAKFLLKNLITRYSIAGASHTWPYGDHKEDLVVITDGGYAPFVSLNAFAVFSRDLNALLPNTKLTIDLIRNFRKGGNIKDPVKNSKLSQEEFASAPVLISNKAILRTKDEEIWENVSKVDLLHAFSSINWDDTATLSWRRSNISELIAKAFAGSDVQFSMDGVLGFVDVVYELFDRMRIMMKDKYFRHMILNGNIVVINTVVDSDRRPSLVVPFVV